MKTKLTIDLSNLEKVKRFTNIITTFESDIDILRGRYVLDAKSIMGLFTISLLEPVDIEIHSDDEDEIVRFNEIMNEFKKNI